jgi:hypothetical protein
MYLFVLPISGGNFPSQIAMLRLLLEVDIKSNLYLATSGGNVATYLVHAAHWDVKNIEIVLKELQCNMFSRSWSSFFITNFFMSYFYGSLYKNGKGCDKLLKTFLTEEMMIEKEIWTGVYSEKKKSSQLFCNISKEDSILHTDNVDSNIYQLTENKYLNGNIDIISQVVNASASIPSVVNPQLVENDLYVDGGMGNASPFIVLQDAIYKLALRTKSLHLYYLNSCNLNFVENKDVYNFIQNIQNSMDTIFRTMLINDRISCYQLIKKLVDRELFTEEFKLDIKSLLRWKRHQLNYPYTLSEIYCNKNFTINITNFDTNNLLNSYYNSYEELYIRIYY